MSGKILRIANNDLYGNVDDRRVIVFASFTHVKYMNHYVIFTFFDEYEKKKLYFGSVHVKEDSLVIFAVRNEVVGYISEFINQFMNEKINKEDYEIIDISKMKKVELVSYNNMDFDKLVALENIAILKNKPQVVEEEVKKKPIFLYIILGVLILLLLGITYLYFNPDAFSVEYKKLDCKMNSYNNLLEMNYEKEMMINFDSNDKVSKISVVEIYVFNDLDKYMDFKENNRQNEYFNNDGTYKYDDNNLELRIIYEEKTIIDNYKEMFSYLKKEGYSCIEGIEYE